MIVSQPEFGRCFADRVARHVLGDGAAPEDLKALEDVFAQTRRVKPVVREALRRFALGWQRRDPALAIGATAAASAAPMPSERGSAVSLPPLLRQAIDTHCLDCHDRDQPERDFTAARLDRVLVGEMLHRVAWGDMPKSSPLAKTERDRIVRMFLERLWPPGPERRAAERYYTGLRALPTHTVATIHNTVPGHVATPFGLETYIDPAAIQYSPGFVSTIAKSALLACGDRSGAELDRCIREAVAPVRFVNRRLPWLDE